MSTPEDTKTIPVIEESLEVSTQRRTTGVVHVEKRVFEFDEPVEQLLASESVAVERIPCNTIVEGDDPGVRRVGNTTIIPVLEERAVVSIVRVLIEEVHITTTIEQQQFEDTVQVRRERVDVSRTGDPSVAADQLDTDESG